MRRGRVDKTKAAADELTKKVDAVAKGGDDRGLGEGFGGVGDPKAETKTKRKLGFFFRCAPRERKETWTISSATMGAASPWFTGAGSNPADGESKPN